MPEPHLIEDLCFDVAFESEASAFDEQARLAAFAQGPALRIIDEVFDAASAGGEVWRFERIGLDLGTVSGDDMEAQWASRLRERLRTALDDGRAARRAASPAAALPGLTVLRREQTQLDALMHFVEHGCWPWHVAAAEDPVALAWEVLHHSGPALRTRLQAAMQQPHAERRLAQQFPADWRQAALQPAADIDDAALASNALQPLRMWLDEALLGPSGVGQPAWWERLLRDDPSWLRRRLPALGRRARVRRRLALGLPEALLFDVVGLWLAPSERAVVADAVREASAPAPVLWEATLAYLWVGEGAERVDGFRAESYRSSVQRQLALREEIAAADLRLADDGAPSHGNSGIGADTAIAAAELAALQLALDAGPAAGGVDAVDAPLQVDHAEAPLSAGWLQRPAPQRRLGPSELPGLDRAQHALLRVRFAAALTGGSTETIGELWQALHDDDPQGLREMLAMLCATASVRRRIVRHFSDAMLLQLAALWVGRDAAQEVAALLAGLSRDRGSTAAADEDPRASCWELGIGLLPRASGSAFDAQALAQGVRLQMACRDALARGTLPSEPDLWRTLREQHTGWLRDTMRHALAASTDQRRHIARTWPDTMLRELVRLQFGADADFVGAAVNGAARWHAANAGQTALPMSARGIASTLWEFSLAHPWDLAEAPLDRADFTDRLLRRMAPLAGLPPAELARQMAAAGPGRSAPDDPWHARWLECLSRAADPPRHAAAAQMSRGALSRALESPLAAERLVEQLTPESLNSVLRWLRPTDHAPLARCVDRVLSACRAIGARAGSGANTAIGVGIEAVADADVEAVAVAEVEAVAVAEPKAQPVAEPKAQALEDPAKLASRHLLRELFEEGRLAEPVGFTVRLADALADALRPPDPAAWRAALAAELARIAAADPGARAVAEALAADAAQRVAPAALSMARSVVRDEETDPAQPIFIANAGIVLAAPYLPRLFMMLGLADERAFVDERAAQRAALLLQFSVTGEPEAPEPLLVLNKLLCGIERHLPVPREIVVTDAERSAVHGMLQAMIDHWKVIGKTSIAGLRESFLQREGRLERKDEAWQLRVEPRAFDMLLDQLPWGYATLKFPWMERVIHVDWR